MARFNRLLKDSKGYYIVVSDQTIEVTPSAKDKKTAELRDRNIFRLIGNQSTPTQPLK